MAGSDFAAGARGAAVVVAECASATEAGNVACVVVVVGGGGIRVGGFCVGDAASSCGCEAARLGSRSCSLCAVLPGALTLSLTASIDNESGRRGRGDCGCDVRLSAACCFARAVGEAAYL